MDDEDLAGLLAKARAGDEAAFRTLVERYEGDVRMMVRGRLPQVMRSQFDSMDFVQAVWQSVFTDLDRKGDEASPRNFRAFLAGVARNKVYEAYRHCTKTKKHDLKREEPLYVRKGNRDVPRDVPASCATPSQDAQATDRLDQLTAGRSPEEVEIIRLRRMGLTFGEIAAQTGLHERAVRRVIESVRKTMEDRKWQ